MKCVMTSQHPLSFSLQIPSAMLNEVCQKPGCPCGSGGASHAQGNSGKVPSTNTQQIPETAARSPIGEQSLLIRQLLSSTSAAQQQEEAKQQTVNTKSHRQSDEVVSAAEVQVEIERERIR